MPFIIALLACLFMACVGLAKMMPNNPHAEAVSEKKDDAAQFYEDCEAGRTYGWNWDSTRSQACIAHLLSRKF